MFCSRKSAAKIHLFLEKDISFFDIILTIWITKCQKLKVDWNESPINQQPSNLV